MNVSFTIPPSPLIQDNVCLFWQVHRHKEPSLNEYIIPKGNVEIIFNLDTTPLEAEVNNHSIIVPKCFVQGYSTSPIQLHLAGNQIFFGVILCPSAVNHIFHFHPNLVSNCVIDLTLIDPSLQSLWQQLGEQKSFESRVTIFTNWLLKKLPQLSLREKAIDHYLNAHSNINLTVAHLANFFCYSTRQLSRKMHELTGMNTEQAILYKRYLQAVHLIHTSNLSLTEIAYRSNFFDQSHFIKTFKGLSQLTPYEYRQRKSDTVGHIIEPVV